MGFFQDNIDNWLQKEVASSGDPLVFLEHVERALERLKEMSEEEIVSILPDEEWSAAK